MEEEMQTNCHKKPEQKIFYMEGTLTDPIRKIEKNDPDYPEKLDCKPVSLSYDELRDRFCLTGTGGVLLEMPGCSHCNSLKRYPVDTLYARACSGFKILLLGSDGFRKVE